MFFISFYFLKMLLFNNITHDAFDLWWFVDWHDKYNMFINWIKASVWKQNNRIRISRTFLKINSESGSIKIYVIYGSFRIQIGSFIHCSTRYLSCCRCILFPIARRRRWHNSFSIYRRTRSLLVFHESSIFVISLKMTFNVCSCKNKAFFSICRKNSFKP